MRDALAADLGGIIDKVRAKAMAGDMQAARIILDRLVPSLRPVEIPTAVSIPAGATLAGQATQIVTALGGDRQDQSLGSINFSLKNKC